MTSYFLYYGFFILSLAVVLGFFSGIIQKKKDWAFWNKHTKKNKKWYTTLAVIALLLLWLQIEDALGETTLVVFWSIHIVLFGVLAGWNFKTIYADHVRIASAIERKKRREQSK